MVSEASRRARVAMHLRPRLVKDLRPPARPAQRQSSPSPQNRDKIPLRRVCRQAVTPCARQLRPLFEGQQRAVRGLFAYWLLAPAARIVAAKIAPKTERDARGA